MVTPAMITNYIKHYYNDCEWSEQNTISLISSKLIRAQVCFAKGGSGVYFNATVIDVPPTGFGDTAVSIDTQLFLAIANLKSDFTVTATDNSGKSETVGGNIETINTGTYTYTSASLSNYDLAHTSSFASAPYNGEQHFKSVAVSSSKYDQARIRFFIRAEDKDTIQKILNDKIPDGLVGEPTAYYTEAYTQSNSIAMLGDGSWPYFPQDKADGRAINAINYTKACRIMWYFEIGTCDPDAGSLAKAVENLVGIDKAGFNFGPFQTNREGITNVLKYYCNQVDTTSAASKALLPWSTKKITAASSKDPTLVSNLKKISLDNPNGVMLACTMAWAREYYFPTALNWYKKSGLDCALGLAMCMYIINSGTAITSYGSRSTVQVSRYQ